MKVKPIDLIKTIPDLIYGMKWLWIITTMETMAILVIAICFGSTVHNLRSQYMLELEVNRQLLEEVEEMLSNPQ